jgi:hypothetical protein
VNDDQLERHYLRRLVGLVLVAVLLGALAAAVFYSSRLGAQESEKIEIICTNGWCRVPEPQLMRILRARLCGVAT